MPTPQRLSAGSLTPSARPVSNFLQFKNDGDPAQPSRPSQLGQVGQVNIIQRQADRSIQGVNPIAELTEALKPLTQLYDYGAELYASDQYKKGQNEILRAASSINRDTIAKSYAYAADNREVSAANPVAGVLMDQANPFRQAGRVNQASQWVAGLTPQAFRSAWIQQGGSLAKLDPGDPAITAVQSQITNQLASSFGLDEFSPGFQEYVLPQINKQWEAFQDKQFKAHVNHQKAIGTAQTADVMTSMLLQPTGPSQEVWGRMLAQQMATYGLTGEPQEMMKNAALQALQKLRMREADPNTYQQAREAIRRLGTMPSGIVGVNGESLNISEAYGPEMVGESAEISRDIKTITDNRREARKDQIDMGFSGDASLKSLRRGSPAWIEIFNGMRADPANADLSDADLIEILDNQSESANNYQVNTFQVDGLDDFFDRQRELSGAGWDEGAARREFRDLIRNAPREIKQDAQRQWERLVDRSERKSNGSVNSSVMRSNIDLATKSILEKILPPKGLGMIQKAEKLKVPLLDYIIQKDGVSAAAAVRTQNYIRKTAEDAILAKEQELGRPLTDGEQGIEIGKVIKDTLADEDLMNGFRPTIVPSTPQAAAPTAAPTGESLPPSYYSAAQPVPEAVVKSGVPIYSPQTTIDLLGTAAGGGPLPATVKRAARAANMTTGEFLLKQADQLGLGDQIPEGMRESVRKVAVRERGTEETLIGAAPRSSTPLGYASNAFLNIITGTRPAAAATLPASYTATADLGAPAELRSFSPQVSSITYDTNQSGIDVFFENKQFPAVLRGRVKEVGFQGGNDSGYGNFIVIESRDPRTGAVVDVLYSHLASKPRLRAGQPIDAGQIIGRQGGTGRVRSADGTIASIDFLAPAPAGSKSMTPYRYYDQLRRSIAQQLRN